MLQSNFDIVSLWAAHQGIGELSVVDPYRPESALIVRPSLDVHVVKLPPGGGAFTAALASGVALAAAAEAANAVSGEFDLAACLASLIRSGAFAALDSPRIDRT